MTRVVVIAWLAVAAANQSGPPPLDVIPPGGLWGPVAGAGTPAATDPVPHLPLALAPRSTADMATVNPALTLVPDEQDAPVAVSVAEAQKSRGHDH